MSLSLNGTQFHLLWKDDYIHYLPKAPNYICCSSQLYSPLAVSEVPRRPQYVRRVPEAENLVQTVWLSIICCGYRKFGYARMA